MYTFTLFLHSWLRWIILVVLVVTFIKAWVGLYKNKPYGPPDTFLASFLLGCVHLQVVIGLILYFALSPIVQLALQNMGQAMKNPVLRYWSTEHLVGMLIFAALVHIGKIASKRAQSHRQKHKKIVVFLGIALLLLIVTTPWPFRKDIGRPLFETPSSSLNP